MGTLVSWTLAYVSELQIVNLKLPWTAVIWVWPSKATTDDDQNIWKWWRGSKRRTQTQSKWKREILRPSYPSYKIVRARIFDVKKRIDFWSVKGTGDVSFIYSWGRCRLPRMIPLFFSIQINYQVLFLFV